MQKQQKNTNNNGDMPGINWDIRGINIMGVSQNVATIMGKPNNDGDVCDRDSMGYLWGM